MVTLLETLWQHREEYDDKLISSFKPLSKVQDDSLVLSALWSVVAQKIADRYFQNAGCLDNIISICDADEITAEFVKCLNREKFEDLDEYASLQAGKAIVLISNILNQNKPFSTQRDNVNYLIRAVEDISRKYEIPIHSIPTYPKYKTRLLQHIFSSEGEYQKHVNKILRTEIPNVEFCKKFYESQLPLSQISKFRQNKYELARRILQEQHEKIFS